MNKYDYVPNMDIIPGRIPPNSIESEQSILGAVLTSKEALQITTDTLNITDFYMEAHREIFGACIEISKTGKPVDILLAVNKLKQRQTLEKIGGSTYLSDLSLAVSSVANIKYHLEIVKSKSLLRRLIQAADIILETAYAGREDINNIFEIAEKEIFGITQQSSISREIRPILDAVMENLKNIDKRINDFHSGKTIQGIPTGISKLDILLGGMVEGYIVIAARPSMGKTALAMNIALHQALEERKKVAIFSLETTDYKLIDRMLSVMTEIPLKRIKNGNIIPKERDKIIQASSKIASSSLHIDDTGNMTVLDIKSKARNIMRTSGLDIIYIDYLQLLESTEGRSQYEKFTKISRQLHDLTRELHIPVVILSQLSRATEGRADHKPTLGDLRETGAIEQDADVVMFVYRDAYYNPVCDNPLSAEILISKNKDGEIGTAYTTFKEELTQFIQLESWKDDLEDVSKQEQMMLEGAFNEK